MDLAISHFSHIAGGAIGLAAGYFALFARKGSPLHNHSGQLFVLAMVIMGFTGSYLAVFKPESLSVLTGFLTVYLAVSSWLTVRLRNPSVASTLIPAMFAVGIGSLLLYFGIQASTSSEGMKDGFPPAPYFLFGIIALFAATMDFVFLYRGRLSPSNRLIRHLWRMLVALLIAAVSFFLGQQQVFPENMQIWYILAIPPAIVLFALPYWVYRAITKFKRHNKAMHATSA